MADCVAIQQECIAAGRATRAKIVSQYKGDCIVTGRSWALGWGAGRSRHAQGELDVRRQQGARRAGRRAWVCEQARGAQQGAAAGAGARGARGLGVAGLWARSLGVRAGSGLCTRPIFDPF